MIQRVQDIQKKLNAIREDGFKKGYSTGWSKLDEIYTVVPGYPLFVAGAPFSGKTEFVFELMLSLSVREKFKWIIYSGEHGGNEVAVAELCHKYVGKPYYKKTVLGEVNPFAMSEGERSGAEYFIGEHFYFIDNLQDFTVKKFYDIVDTAEKQYGVTFNGTLLDPFNDVKNESNSHGRTDLWLEDDLKYIRNISAEKKRIDIVVNHIADVKPVTDKNTGMRYVPPALPTEWAGGRVWHRRAFTMLLIYRPPGFILDENGRTYEANETIVYNQKAKPKGSGKVGNRSLLYDWKTNRYYEKDEYGTLHSPFGETKQHYKNIDHPDKRIEPISQDKYNEDLPF